MLGGLAHCEVPVRSRAITSSGAVSDRVGGAAASERADQIVIEGVEVRGVDRIAGSCTSICCVRCVARVRVLERGAREGALCIHNPDRVAWECIIFIRAGIAIRRGIVHVTVTRRWTREKCGRHTFTNEIGPQGGVTIHTKSEWPRAKRAQSDQLVSESSKG